MACTRRSARYDHSTCSLHTANTQAAHSPAHSLRTAYTSVQPQATRAGTLHPCGPMADARAVQ